MAMTIKTDGLTQVSEMLTKLGNRAQEVASAALYQGAGIMANAMNSAVKSIQTEPFRYAQEGQTRLPSPQEKAALNNRVGIAKFGKNGAEIDTLVGLGNSGYAEVAGKKKPVAVIARGINSGTSFMKKQPVFRKAKNQNQNAATAAIAAKAEEMFNEIINGQ